MACFANLSFSRVSVVIHGVLGANLDGEKAVLAAFNICVTRRSGVAVWSECGKMTGW